MAKKKTSAKTKTVGKTIKKRVLSFATIKELAKKQKKQTRNTKGKLVILNAKGNIYAHCKETKYGIAWRAPSKKKGLKTGLITTRITDKTRLEELIQKVK